MAWQIATCDDCGKEEFDQIIIHNELWRSIADPRDILCVSCIEERLDRKLSIDDLRPCMITDSIMIGYRIGKDEFERVGDRIVGIPLSPTMKPKTGE